MNQHWKETADRIGPEISEYAARHDREGSFVAEGFDALRREGCFAALVPEELGGGGARYAEVCDLIRTVAKSCGSTALAFSMHSHLVAATVWKHRHGQPGEALLRMVADGAILVSTGATDWLSSNCQTTRVPGGYRVSGVKVFGSGSPAATTMITSARYEDPDEGPVVLHFPLPFGREGVTIGSDWDTLGMRGTGSNTIRLDDVFVPEESIGMRRPADVWHPAFSVISTVALPLIVSAYVGLAEEAAERAIARARRKALDGDTQPMVGEMRNALFVARTALDRMVNNVAEYDFAPTIHLADQATTGKAVAVEAAIDVTQKAMFVAGGAGFFRKSGIERILRDAQAGRYHPLHPKAQHRFSGRHALGVDVATGELSRA